MSPKRQGARGLSRESFRCFFSPFIPLDGTDHHRQAGIHRRKPLQDLCCIKVQNGFTASFSPYNVHEMRNGGGLMEVSGYRSIHAPAELQWE